ncbi:MAG: peptidoglycan-binding protein [Gallionella sp.]|nr:MAG: peptidoglycan-binding protein [Gallionella sp.]
MVPILLDTVEPPIGFRSIQAAELTDWQQKHPSSQFEQLLKDIRGILQTPATPSVRQSADPKPDTSVKPRMTWLSTKKYVWASVASALAITLVGASYFLFSGSPTTNTETGITSTQEAPDAENQGVGSESLSVYPGSHGASVLVIQQILKEEGYFEGYTDGTYGPATIEAVKKFQQANGIVPDGILGLRTATEITKLRNKKR